MIPLTPNTEEYTDFSVQIQHSREAGNVQEQYRLCDQFLIRLNQDPTEQRYWRGFCQEILTSIPHSIEDSGANGKPGSDGSPKHTGETGATDTARYALQAFERLHDGKSHDVRTSAVKSEIEKEKEKEVVAAENLDANGLAFRNASEAGESVEDTKADGIATSLRSTAEGTDEDTDANGRIPRYPSHPEFDFGSQGDGAGVTESPRSRTGSDAGNSVSLNVDLKSKKRRKRLVSLLRKFLGRTMIKEEEGN